MAFISGESLGFPPQLSNEELRRMALKMNEGLKKQSSVEAKAQQEELNRILQEEQRKMKEYEARMKK